MKWIPLFLILVSSWAFAQERPPQEPPFVESSSLDQEIDEAEGPLQPKAETVVTPEKSAPPQKTVADDEDSEAEDIATEAVPTEPEPTLASPEPLPPMVDRPPIIPVAPKVSSNELSSSPKLEPQFVKPPGPAKGGSIRVPHPYAGKGLLRINRDGSYQYKTAQKSKSQSSSLRIGPMTPPKIAGGTSAVGQITYKSMYGDQSLTSAVFEYEWQPFTSFGRVGLNLGSGFATARANGFFATARASGTTKSEEVYSLYVFPVSAFLSYRFEYARRQKIVPYINAGGTYFALMENRDDNKRNFSGAAAVGGGGGFLFSITAWDHQSAFTLAEEYGIVDMYFAVEARVMQGLDQKIDFTSQVVNAGITVDF